MRLETDRNGSERDRFPETLHFSAEVLGALATRRLQMEILPDLLMSGYVYGFWITHWRYPLRVRTRDGVHGVYGTDVHRSDAVFQRHQATDRVS